ncbi:DUF1232 domain-containing protein [Candidatus Dojkabacteria bacterium]|nr:DUF1232 domain-containing protein [Candidatus Dojkabacteria bacterium]
MKDFIKNNWILMIAIVYILLPVDVIPDSIPLVGTGDDFVLIFGEFIRRLITQYKQGKKVFKSNWFLVFVLIYLILRIDLLPDIIPILGTGDDASLVGIEIIRRLFENKNQEKTSNKKLLNNSEKHSEN